MKQFLGTPPDTLLETLNIVVTEAGPERVVATMPVSPKVHQPFGILHGGASVVLAETVASIGASVSIDLSKQHAVGLEINANHIRVVRDGTLTGTATPLHKGRSTHVWNVTINDENGKLVCTSRCTLAIIEARE
ncbi:hotdog fold thioesterase [soil metagenome]